jgi:acyl-lipid omega-6 desaturase (Delta-12 desaturase)
MSLPAGGFMVRLFMLQHDCGHLSMFKSRKLNDWVGRALGVITLTPYDYWRHSHAMHHAGSGNLEKRGMGDINTLTVAEYEALSFWGRFGYRLYRNPIVMFGIGPVYVFIFNQRLPPDCFRQGRASWMSVLLTNLGILLSVGLVIYFLGWLPLLTIHLPVVFVGAAAGVWLFYVQHQFDETHWEHSGNWDHETAALHGSSYYDLPKPLMWLTGNIGIHHLHHLSSRIPFYRLPQVLRDFPELRDVGRLTIWESLKCVRLTLWDEASKKLVSFREARAMMPLRMVAAE